MADDDLMLAVCWEGKENVQVRHILLTSNSKLATGLVFVAFGAVCSAKEKPSDRGSTGLLKLLGLGCTGKKGSSTTRQGDGGS